MGWGPDAAGPLRDALQLCSRLETLKLQDNPLGDAGAEAIAQAAVGLGGLKSLDLYSTRMTSQGVGVLLEVIVSARTNGGVTTGGARCGRLARSNRWK